MTAENEPLRRLLENLLDERKELKEISLSDLSGLDQKEMEAFNRFWAQAGVDRKRSILARLSEMAADNFDLDFDKLFLLGSRDADAEVRAESVMGLGHSEDGALVGALVRALSSDPAEAVRVASARALGKFVLLGELEKISGRAADRAHDALLHVLENAAGSLELRRRALEAISPWTSPRVAEFIADMYRSEAPEDRVSAVYAMGMNCESRWLETLFRELRSAEPIMRYEAAHSCGEIADQAAVPHLLPLLSDDDIEVRTAAIVALGQIGGKEAKRALRGLLREDSEQVREAAEGALAQIAAEEGSLEV